MHNLKKSWLQLEKCAGFHDDGQDEVYVSKKRKQEFLTKTLEELLNRPRDSCTTAQGSPPTITARRSANSSQDLSPLNSRFANFNLGESFCQTTVPAREQTKLAHQFASQADIRATIPLGEQVSPLDDVTNNNDRWSTYQLDDNISLSSKDKIPLDENLLLRETADTTQVSGGGRDMERYCLHHNDIIKISSTIRLEYQRRFTASIRDRTWSAISISRECPDRCRRCEMVLREQGAG